jgi:hypothetical protein
MTFQQIIDHFHAKRAGKEWVTLCTGHPDRNPSLNITHKAGKILFICRSRGCSLDQILAGAGLTLSDLNGAAEPPRSEKARPCPENLKAMYEYTDENGKLLYQVCRFEEPGKEKNFRQRRPDGRGGWIENTDGVRRVLFNLPALRTEETILVVEGEKDVVAASVLCLTATCSPMGAGKWRPEYSETLRGKSVYIIPDNDEPGRKHAETVARSLWGIAKTIVMVRLPEPCKDLSDLKLPRKALEELLQAAPEWKLHAAAVVEQEQLVELKLPEFPRLEGPLAVLCDALGPDLAYEHKAIVALAVVGMKISGRSKLASDPFMQPRLYGCLIGPPNTAKSPTISRMIAALAPVMQGDVFCEESIDSAAALVEALREHNRLLLTPDEMADAFVKGRPSGRTNLSGMFTEWLTLFESNILARRVLGKNGGQVRLTDVHFGKIASATPKSWEEIWAGIAGAASGLQSRYIVSSSDAPLPRTTTPNDQKAVDHAVAELASNLTEPVPVVRLTDDAQNAIASWKPVEDVSQYPRVLDHGKRFAWICAVADRRTEIDGTLMWRGLRFAQHQIACRDKFTPEDAHGWVQAFENRILRFLKVRKTGASLKTLRDSISPHKCAGGHGSFNQALSNLLKSGAVIVCGRTQKDADLFCLA